MQFDIGRDDDRIPFAFGKVEAPGAIRYAKRVGGDLWVVRALALGQRSVTARGGESAGEIEALLSVTTENGKTHQELAGNGLIVGITFKSGSLLQGVDPGLAAADPTWNATGVITNPATGEQRGICYAIEQYVNFATTWATSGGLPRWRYRMRGSRLLNTTTGLVEYTENLFWQLRYWATDPDGLYHAPADLNGPAFNVAAAIGDQVIAGGSKRYAAHILMEAGTTQDWVKMFRLLGDCFWFENEDSLWTPIVDRPAAPVASYSDLHYTEKEIVAGAPADATQLLNKVTIEYTDTTGPVNHLGEPTWKIEPVTLTTQELDDGLVEEVPQTFKMYEIHDRAIAEEKLPLLLYGAQDDYRASLEWRANTGERSLGEVVTQAIPSHGLADDFRILSLDEAEDGTAVVELQIMAPRKWQTSSSATPVRVGSTLPDPYALPPAIVLASIGFIEELFIEASATRARGTLTHAAPTDYPWLAGVEVELSINGGTFRNLTRDAAPQYYLPDLREGGTYTFRLRTRSSRTGLVSAWTTKSFPVAGKTTPPTDVPFLYVAARNGQVHCVCQQAIDIDLAGYEWRYGKNTDTWESATVIDQSKGLELWAELPYSDKAPGGVWRIFVKAFDSGPRYSTNAKTFDVAVRPAGPDVTAYEIDLNLSGVVNAGTYGIFNDLYVNGNLIIEGAMRPSTMKRIAMLARPLSPAQIDAEIVAKGFSSIAEWEAANPNNLWAPLPMVNGACVSSFQNFGSYVSGTSRRNLEVRLSINGITRLGLQRPDIICHALPGLFANNLYGVFIRSDKTGTQARRLPKFQLSTNNPYAQACVICPAGQPFYLITEARIPVFTETGTINTDAGGLADYTLLRPFTSSEIAHPLLTVMGSHPTALIALPRGLTGTNVVNLETRRLDTGALYPNVAVRVDVWDYGEGGGATVETL